MLANNAAPFPHISHLILLPTHQIIVLRMCNRTYSTLFGHYSQRMLRDKRSEVLSHSQARRYVKVPIKEVEEITCIFMERNYSKTEGLIGITAKYSEDNSIIQSSG